MKALMTIILIVVQILPMKLLLSMKQGSKHADKTKGERLSGVDTNGWQVGECMEKDGG